MTTYIKMWIGVLPAWFLPGQDEEAQKIRAKIADAIEGLPRERLAEVSETARSLLKKQSLHRRLELY